MVKEVGGAGYKRQILGEILPLDAPLSLHIFVSGLCNLKCRYCLHSLNGDLLGRYTTKRSLMTSEIFSKVISQALRFKHPLTKVIFAGWGEPLMHPDLPRMICAVKKSGVAKEVEVVTNGVLLSKSISDALIDAGLDRIRVSVQGIDSGSCEKTTNVPFDFDRFIEGLTYFFSKRKKCRVYIKTIDQLVPSDSNKKQFYDKFNDICDEIAIEHLIPAIKGVDHSSFESQFRLRHCGGDAINNQVCPFPFYMAAVHPDGKYAPCCAPKFPEISSGQDPYSVYEIWHSKEMNAFRLHQLSGERGRSDICQSCLSPKFDVQKGDELDSYAESLKFKYQI